MRLLSNPKHATLSLFGLLIRFPIAMRSISCMMLISATMKSLWAAGTVSGTLMIVQATASPALGKLADRFGQQKTLVVTCIGHVITMMALIYMILSNAPFIAIMIMAICIGLSSVPVDSFIRTRWASMVADGALKTAYALETVLDEVVFLLGPLIAVSISTGWHRASGLVLCTILTCSGSIALAMHRCSEPPLTPEAKKNNNSAIGMSWVRVLMIIYLALGIFLGSIDVMMITFAKEIAKPTLAGFLLSTCAVGSLVGGICYGAINWSVSQPKMLLIITIAFYGGTIPLMFTGKYSPTIMAVSAFIAGLSVAPLLTACSNLLEALTPKNCLSEGFSWLSSAGWMGFALGVSISGKLSDKGSVESVACVTMGAGILALLVGLFSQGYLLKKQDQTLIF